MTELDIDQLDINQTHKVECVDLDQNGFGLSFVNNSVLITPNLIPGEHALVKTSYRKGPIWVCILLERFTTSSSRVDPVCTVSDICGGCSIQHVNPINQHKFKHHRLQYLLFKFGSISHTVKPVIKDPHLVYGYRNRTSIPLLKTNTGKLFFGYYKQGSHEIVNINSCPVLKTNINDILCELRNDLENLSLAIHHDLPTKNTIRHVCIRTTEDSRQILICLVTSNDISQLLKSQAHQWLSKFKQLNGVTMNIQPNNNNVIFGPNTTLLAGIDYIVESFCGLQFVITTTDFFQINLRQAEVIVRLICQWITANFNGDTVVDAYSGIGAISLPLAMQGFKVLGLEINRSSVSQAKRNSELNDLPNSQFIAGDVVDLLDHILNSNHSLVLDPPRKGLSSKLLDVISRVKPATISYLSCNPATLARDLKIILNAGIYKIDLIQPIDFFPQTMHLETLVCLIRTSS